MPIPLGIIAAAGAGGGEIEAYEHIQSIEIDSTTTLTFSSIPADYKHLQVRVFARQASSSAQLQIRMNGDTGSNYSFHGFYGAGSSVGGFGTINTTRIDGPYLASDNNEFMSAVIDFYDYKDTNKFKTAMFVYGVERSASLGSAFVGIGSGAWRNTNAITSLTFIVGANYVGGSRFGLYGIKG